MTPKSLQKLRVWWIPQVPMTPFIVPVSSVEEGAKILRVLADYDRFQLAHHVKPDYCNVGGLQVWDDGEWTDWYPEDGGDPEEILETLASGSTGESPQ